MNMLRINVLLDEHAFINAEMRYFLIHDRLEGRAAFISHARNVYLQQPNVGSFILRFSRPQDNISDVRDWISIATRSSAEEVEIDFSDPDTDTTYPMPDEVHQLSHSLLSLRLSGCGVNWPDVNAITIFRSLRTLSMSRAEIQGHSLEVLLTRCPCLEELKLVKLRLDGVNIANIQCSRLLRLTIDDCQLNSGLVLVNAPMLRYFKYSGKKKIFHLTLPKVEEAVLDFGSESSFCRFGDFLGTLLQSLISARSLTLCSYMSQVITAGRDPFLLPPHIRRLEHMILSTELHRDELPGIALLLRSYEKLQSITFVMVRRNVLENYVYPFDDVVEDFYFWREQSVPIPCLERSLKKVTVEGFEARIDEMAILDLFLKRAKCLKEIVIIASKETPENVERYIAAAERLEGCKKRSRHLKIVEELEELDRVEPSSAACKELLFSVEEIPDALLPVTRGPQAASWDRWFRWVRSSHGNKWWAHKGSDFF